MLSDSFAYTKTGLFEDIIRWVLLFICQIFHPLWMGYQWKIFQGKSAMEPLNNWIEMLINGVKLIIVNFVYLIIPIIVFIASGGMAIISLFLSKPNDPVGIMSAVIALAVAIIVSLVVLFVFALLGTIANIRFARMDSFGEAFNFNAILEQIRKIGWLSYIIALIVLFIVLLIAAIIAVVLFMILGIILAFIPFIGPFLFALELLIVLILIGPFFGVWATKYITLIYDSV